jgi:hypothetical protein
MPNASRTETTEREHIFSVSVAEQQVKIAAAKEADKRRG